MQMQGQSRRRGRKLPGRKRSRSIRIKKRRNRRRPFVVRVTKIRVVGSIRRRRIKGGRSDCRPHPFSFLLFSNIPPDHTSWC